MALALSALVITAGGATVAAADAASASRNAAKTHSAKQRGDIPRSQIAIQLWSFTAYVGFGTDAATQARLERSCADSARSATAR